MKIANDEFIVINLDHETQNSNINENKIDTKNIITIIII